MKSSEASKKWKLEAGSALKGVACLSFSWFPSIQESYCQKRIFPHLVCWGFTNAWWIHCRSTSTSIVLCDFRTWVSCLHEETFVRDWPQSRGYAGLQSAKNRLFGHRVLRWHPAEGHCSSSWRVLRMYNYWRLAKRGFWAGALLFCEALEGTVRCCPLHLVPSFTFHSNYDYG